MNNSEKCYYAVIGNKKRGKFSGAGPIQVAKKVASKKLKAGREMEFYLDEVAGKKKRLGPYQARKDNKSGRVAVVKGRKVMKGGVLSTSDRNKLKAIFNNFNNNGNGFMVQQREFRKARLPLIPFGREPIVYFCLYGISNMIYKYAVFKESIENIYIMIYNSNSNIDIVSMTDFFLNPYYSSNFYEFNTLALLNKNYTLESLKKSEIIESRTINTEAEKICELLYTQTGNKFPQKAMIYVPNYYQPRIKKCVYSNLTFGVLDEETVNERISQQMIQSEVPKSFYQLYLIKQQSFFNGYYEPVIYIQLPLPNKKELEKQKLSLQSQINPYFNYCIYTDPTDRNRLKVIIYNPKSETLFKSNTSDFNEILSTDDKIKMACSILLTIPVEFGELKRVRRIANNIINPQTFVGFQSTLREPLFNTFQRSTV